MRKLTTDELSKVAGAGSVGRIILGSSNRHYRIMGTSVGGAHTGSISGNTSNNSSSYNLVGIPFSKVRYSYMSKS